ncbi:MAG TPA: VOC family protein [Gemmatimonadaceae bacterium]
MSAASSAAPYGIAPPAWRLPAATRLGRVRLQVADLARSLEYYERVLGLRVLGRASGSATLGAHGDARPIVELHEHPGATPVPRRGRLGLYHFAILLPDRPALGRFLLHLGRLGVHAGMSDHHVSEAVYLSDPDGLGIEVYADRPREEWRHEGQQLVMATEPLDVQAVVRAADGGAWTGMPVGTTLGHVHLFVADLEESAAFYHDGLGFDKVVWSYPGALFMSAGGYHHHLGTNTWAAGAQRALDGDARMLEWEIVLPDEADIDAAARNLESRGVIVAREGRGLLAVDPTGTKVRLLAD